MKLFSILICAIFFIPTQSFAAVLTLDPTTGEHGPGDTFVVNIRAQLDSFDECINAADIYVVYPPEFVKAVAVSKGESILTLWAEEPTIDGTTGVVHLSGGIPGGYCGRVLGDPGKTDILGKVVFSVPAFQVGGTPQTGAGKYAITLRSDSALLLNDGSGTKAKLTLVDAAYVRLSESKNLKNEWTEAIQGDNLPPDEFQAEIQRSDLAFNKKFFLVFSTVDKQSGISHYEILEEDPDRRGSVFGQKSPAVFARAISPYVLKDQTLRSKITIRAFDNAGNRREVVILPKGMTQPSAAGIGGSTDWMSLVVTVVAILILVPLLYVLTKRKKRTVEL